mgnify:CR=1 FL=1
MIGIGIMGYGTVGSGVAEVLDKNAALISKNAAEDIPKSFIVCYEGKKHSVYLSQMATATLAKRFDTE